MKSDQWLLPTPLLEPHLWPEPNPLVLNRLPLDIAAFAGGPLKDWLERAAHNAKDKGGVEWVLPRRFICGETIVRQERQRQIRAEACLGWLSRYPPEVLLTDFDLQMHSRSDVLEVVLELSKALQKCRNVLFYEASEYFIYRRTAEEAFPTVHRDAGELKFTGLLKHYAAEFPEALEFPWEGLRFFAGVLRQEKESGLAHSAARDWARFQALFSPQDEFSELKTLHENELLLNPTAQLVRRSGIDRKRGISIHFRWQNAIKSIEIGWQEAILIDEISESPRVVRSDVLMAAHATASSMQHLFANDGDGRAGAGFESWLHRLVSEHVLFMGSPD